MKIFFVQFFCVFLPPFLNIFCFCFIDYAKAFDSVDHNKLWKILEEMGIPDHLICLLRNLNASQETRTRHGTMDWFKIWKTQQWPQDWKRSVFIPIPKKGNAKECSNYCTVALISHASKVMLKILQARLQ